MTAGSHPHEIARFDAVVDVLELHARLPQLCPVVLESAAHGTPHGRYHILLCAPGEVVEPAADGGLLAALAVEAQAYATAPASNLPFIGGWFLYLSYELVGDIEPRLAALPTHGPVAYAQRMHGAVVVDTREGRCHLLAEPGHGDHMAPIRDALKDLIDAPPAHPEPDAPGLSFQEEPPQRYLDAVERARRYVHDGDVFQANLARRWSGLATDELDLVSLYRRLRDSNPGPFAALARMPELTVLSSSPERLVDLRGDVAQTRPIAGTRPRSDDPQEDAALIRELIEHPKERAEHVMLIDLERNDLGRVCRPGTVEVDEMMVVESYAHVHHIVSNVRGRLRADAGPMDVIRATFPGGTITGCPKVRCMEIIHELEAGPRGAYTGSLGYLSLDGQMDLNILIRSLQVHDGEISLHAGAGIVADSIPEAELAETRAKAKGLLAALGLD